MRKYLLYLLAPLLYIQASATDLSKEETMKLYRQLYLSSAVDTIVWNGSVQACNPGTLASAVYTKAANRINFFRIMNGLPRISVSPNLNKYPQAAALMMRANGQLSHDPPKNWKCYTTDGYKGAAHSCLSTTNFHYFPNTSFVSGFIEDAGDANYFCGHRRWLLYSRAMMMGYGATGTTEAIYIDEQVRPLSLKNAPDYIAYPWNGYVPCKLIFSKWSFALPEGHKVDFAQASVQVTDENGAELPLKLFPVKNDLLDPTITWKMLSLFTEEEERYGINKLKEKGFTGKKLRVTIKGVVVDGRRQDFTYEVRPVEES